MVHYLDFSDALFHFKDTCDYIKITQDTLLISNP